MPGSDQFEHKPEQHFPDRFYSRRLGYKTYDEALVYRGAAEEVRIEFVLPKRAPVPWWGVRSAVEAQVRFQGLHPLTMALWQGPEVKGRAGITNVAYKVELVAHASPGIIAVTALLKALALLLGVAALFVIAIRANPTTFTGLAQEWPKSLKWVAGAVIVMALLPYLPLRKVR